jgi:Tripartite tricarboxylate transporter TctB family
VITNLKDLLGGLVFLLIAAAFAFGALNYDIGTAFRMGPGYFPIVLSGILALLGILIAVRGVRTEGTPVGAIPVRGLICVLLAPVVFGLTVRGLGLAPAIALVVLLGSLGSRMMTPVVAIAATASLTIFCVVVFWWGLGLPLRLFGPWLGN